MHFDCASFIGPWPSGGPTIRNSADLLQRMDRLGIGRALANHTLAWQHNPHYGNALLMQEIATHPRLEACWGLTPGPALDAYGGPSGLEEQLLHHNVRAVRIFPRDHVLSLSDWMTAPFFELLDRLELVVFMDLDQVFLQVGMYDYDASRLSVIEELCSAYPHLSLVITRSGYRAYHNLFALLQRCPNLYLDLSYLATHQGVEEICEKLGPERLLFGTSQPFTEAGGALARLEFAGISSQDRAKIAGGNLEGLLSRAKTSDPSRVAPAPDSAPPATGDYRIVDAHGHLGPYFKFHVPQNDAAGMIRAMDASGVEIACVSSHLAISGDWKLGNLETLKAVKQYPDRLKGHVVVSPNAPGEIVPELERYVEGEGFVAIKIVPDTHVKSVSDPGYQPVWEYAARNRVMVLSHTFHGSPYDDPQLFGEIARRYPEVPILIVHSGALTAAFEGAIRVAQEHPNTFLDISGSYITSAWIERLVAEAGPDRIIYSSDIPFIDIRYGLGRVLYAHLTQGQKRMVLGDNIRRILNFN